MKGVQANGDVDEEELDEAVCNVYSTSFPPLVLIILPCSF